MNTKRRKMLVPALAVLGLVSLGYLLGAAVMFFELPSAVFLQKAFMGARAWNEQRQLPAPDPDNKLPPVSVGAIDKPGKTFDGFTLITYASTSTLSTQAFLMNMRGDVVHRWRVAFSEIWPEPTHLPGRINDSSVCFFGCHLYANGDLLVVFHGLENVANGYGLAKLDKDSKLLWRYSANVHHDVDVGEDGTVYAIRHDLVEQVPRGLGYISTPALVDSLVVLSPDGKEVRKPIGLLEAFRDSAYAPLLCMLERPLGKYGPPPGSPVPRLFDDARRRDVLHANFVKVLTRKLAPKFPLFKPGQVMISLRHLDTIAMLDIDKEAVVWAARGPWKAQHDPQFLDNGHLLIFDNLGSPTGSRVLEYDPQTQAFPWSYTGDNGTPFVSDERGMSQRLPNGNTLIVNSRAGDVWEVTAAKERVWSANFHTYVHTGRRYGPGELTFLKAGQRAREAP